jgi:hypothetical protein
MLLPIYAKPHASPKNRVAHLQAKGLLIPKLKVAARKIEMVGYERLRIGPYDHVVIQQLPIQHEQGMGVQSTVFAPQFSLFPATFMLNFYTIHIAFLRSEICPPFVPVTLPETCSSTCRALRAILRQLPDSLPIHLPS